MELALVPSFFFFNDTATTEIYTLSLHDALPIYLRDEREQVTLVGGDPCAVREDCRDLRAPGGRSEEHTSELQSQSNLVCRLLLEKKKSIPPRSEPQSRTLEQHPAPLPITRTT